MYQYILFDLDGTLTDSREGITKSVQYALDKLWIHEDDLTKLEQFIGPPLHEQFMAAYGLDDADAHMAVAAYRERFSVIGWKENILFEEVPQLLSDLKKAGRIVAIASSKPRIFVDKILEYFHVDQYFDVVSGASLDGVVSTKSQVVQQAIAELNILALSEVVLVGDRLHDVEGAHQNGVACIGVTFGFGGREELETAGADVIAESFGELKQLLL